MYAKLVFARPRGLNLKVTRSSAGHIDAMLQFAGASFADPPLVYAASDTSGSYVSQDTTDRYTLWMGRASFDVSRAEAEQLRDAFRLTATSHIGDDSFDRPNASSVFRAIFAAQGDALAGVRV